MKAIFLISLLISSSYAANLAAPLGLPSAKVLPKGVRNLNYKGIYSVPENKYNNSGASVGLGDSLDTNLSFENILDGTKSNIDKGTLLYAMDQIEANGSDSLGETKGVVNAEANVHVPVFAWGITENWTAAIAVPIIETSVNVDTAMEANQGSDLYQALLTELEKSSKGKFLELQQKLRNPIAYKLEEYGYDPLEDKNETKLGDIKIVNKYKFYEDLNNRFVAGLELTLPTGRRENINNAADLPGGDGQYDLGLLLNYDWIINEGWTASLGAGYTWQVWDLSPVEKRIPYTASSKLSDDIDRRVIRDFGDIVTGSAGIRYQTHGVFLGTGYTFSHKGRDQFTGYEYEQYRYDFLEINTEQKMHAVTAVVGYDTISLFKQKKFPVPLLASVTHSQVVSGKNVVKDPMTVLDLSIFF